MKTTYYGGELHHSWYIVDGPYKGKRFISKNPQVLRLLSREPLKFQIPESQQRDAGIDTVSVKYFTYVRDVGFVDGIKCFVWRLETPPVTSPAERG